MNETTTPLPAPIHRGKVRDIYDLGDHLLLVASDRVSAFDVILPQIIPDKGRLLTAISEFWFGQVSSVIPHHLVSTRSTDFPEPFASAPELAGRSMLVKKAQRVDVECVVRGYVAGSGWKEYQEHGTVGSQRVPAGLTKGGRLPEPLFTPTTKEDEGHDEPITFAEMADQVGSDLAARLRDVSIAVYERGHELAEKHGFLLADTKFEFGFVNDELILIDEVLTPDSSRYWRAQDYQPGRPPESWDKQVIRDHLETLDWNKQAPGPQLPDEIMNRARERYLDVYRALTGRDEL